MSYIKRKSQKQEKRTAKEFGGKVTPASGALSGAKGDVRTGKRNGSNFNQEDFLIENKFTDKQYYKLDLKIWQKIAEEALRDNFRTPLMQIDIQDRSFVIISTNDFTALSGLDTMGCIYTHNKSIRLDKTELECYLDEEDCVGITFEAGVGSVHLVVLTKDYFKYLLGE